MKAFFAKHKLLLVAIPLVILVAVGAFVGVSQYKKSQQIKDLMLEGGRYLSELDYDSAIACYNQVLKLDNKNREASVSLADCYSVTGRDDLAADVYSAMLNYNKRDDDAYRRLAELYIGLGQNERAKELLDTAAENVRMDKISELYDLTHPAAPEFGAKPGDYDERILLEITSPEGFSSIYYTLDGSEPTRESTHYLRSFALPNGSTEVRAVAYNRYGFASEITSGQFNLKIADKTVEVEDSGMRDALMHIFGSNLNNDKVEGIVSLYIIGSAYRVSNCEPTIVFDGSSFTADGRYYSTGHGSVGSLDAIAELPFLETLVVANQSDLDISALSKATRLKRLSLIGNNLTSADLAALSSLTSLEELCLGWNEITDISALSSLTGLKSLSLWGNKITDISPVSKLTSLEYLDVADNAVSDISAVKGLDSLSELWIYDNAVSKIAPACELESLRVLMLAGNPISDADKLREIYPQLTRIDENLLGLGQEDEE